MKEYSSLQHHESTPSGAVYCTVYCVVYLHMLYKKKLIVKKEKHILFEWFAGLRQEGRIGMLMTKERSDGMDILILATMTFW